MWFFIFFLIHKLTQTTPFQILTPKFLISWSCHSPVHATLWICQLRLNLSIMTLVCSLAKVPVCSLFCQIWLRWQKANPYMNCIRPCPGPCLTLFYNWEHVEHVPQLWQSGTTQWFHHKKYSWWAIIWPRIFTLSLSSFPWKCRCNIPVDKTVWSKK